MTDESKLYSKLGKEFVEHGFTTHGAGEYVREDIHTDTVEGFFSIFKRSFKGIYQHCGEAHLHRYLAEYDFRYNNRVRFGIDDTARMHVALIQAEGKRLTYRRVNQEAIGLKASKGVLAMASTTGAGLKCPDP